MAELILDLNNDEISVFINKQEYIPKDECVEYKLLSVINYIISSDEENIVYNIDNEIVDRMIETKGLIQ